VVASNWESGDELGQTWRDRNVFSYGRKEIKVKPDQKFSLSCCKQDHIVQEIDSVEYGLTDIQEYYANTGGTKAGS